MAEPSSRDDDLDAQAAPSDSIGSGCAQRGSSRQCETMVQQMVRDACLHYMTCYYFEQVGSHYYLRSIWSSEEWCVRMYTRLTRPTVRAALLGLACLSMLLSVVEQPVNDRIAVFPRALGLSTFLVIDCIFLVVFVLTVRCLWPTRHHWFRSRAPPPDMLEDQVSWKSLRPTEHIWTFVFGLGVVSTLLVKAIAHGSWHWGESGFGLMIAKNTVRPAPPLPADQAGQVYGKVYTGADVALRVFRCYYILYFSHTMRYAFLSAVYLIKKLGSILGLILVVFLFFYFLILATLPRLDDNPTELDLQQRNEYFGSTEDGLFNLYVALTTANHPDVMMPNYHADWWKMIPLMLFMIVVNLFLLNVFLAVVTAEYGTLVRDYVHAANWKAEVLLRTAFHMMVYGRLEPCHDNSATELERLARELDSLDTHRGVDKARFQSSVKYMIRYLQLWESRTSLYGMIGTRAEEKGELWYCLMDVNEDGYINIEEFEKMHHVIAPDTSEPNFPMFYTLMTANMYELCLRMRGTPDVLVRSTDDSTSLPKDDRWWVRFLKQCTFGTFINTMIILNVLLAVFVYPRAKYQTDLEKRTCTSGDNLWQFFFGFVFLLDVIICSLGQSTKQQPLRYLYSRQPDSEHVYNWMDILVVLMMLLNSIFTCIAAPRSGMIESFVGILRVCRVFRIVLHFKIFKKMYIASSRVIPAVAPQLGLFVIFYYGFSVIGMTLFAGCVTEEVDYGGPGRWETTPWDTYFFATAGTSYYNLNFDNLWSAIVTLFMLMIQNNWHVTVDGYVQCTNTKWTRLYFFLFNLTVAQVMINIFVGILLDVFQVYWDEERREGDASHEDSTISSFYMVLVQRMQYRRNSSNILLADKWQLERKISSQDVYAGPSDAARLAGELDVKTEREGIRDIAFSMPIPAYCRTSTNKIAYCNQAFAALYNTKPVSLIGSYANHEVIHDKPQKLRDVKWNELARERGACIEYNETAIFPDGTEVSFKCHEQPIKFPPFHNTTIVYMYPAGPGCSNLRQLVDRGFLTPPTISRKRTWFGVPAHSGMEKRPGEDAQQNKLTGDAAINYKTDAEESDHCTNI